MILTKDSAFKLATACQQLANALMDVGQEADGFALNLLKFRRPSDAQKVISLIANSYSELDFKPFMDALDEAEFEEEENV